MKKVIDARGKQCPLPVIETKKMLQTMEAGILEVTVDNGIAVQNLIKMAAQKQLEYTSEKIDEDNFVVRITVSEKDSQGLSSKEAGDDAEKTVCYPDNREEHVLVVLSADHMGEGDEKLGKTLMKGFIYALKELDKLPEKILLFNGGAKLSIKGSDSLEDLKELESQGVEVMTCGACLNYYEIADKLAVGSVTNMYVIAESMMEATKILKP